MVQFLNTDIQQIASETRELFEFAAGRPLNPADVENLILNVLIAREGKLRVEANDAINQNLLAFARSIILDYLGELQGAERLAATPASAPMLVTLVNGHTGVTVPQGTRIGSTDGLAEFVLVESVNVPMGTTTVTIDAICSVAGSQGNGYGPGVINKVKDPQAYIVSIENTITTAGGAEQEADDPFRERIKLANSQAAAAGPEDAYRFFAMSANPAIIYVGVNSPAPGEVELLPLMNDGSITPLQVLNQVDAACNPEHVRPLNDLVTVNPPTKINYSLLVELIIFTDALATDVQDAAEAALQEFVDLKRQKLGQDIIESAVKKVATVDGVYKATLPGFTDILIADEVEYGFCTGITVNIVGTNNG